MPATDRPEVPLLLRLRLWLATPIVYRLVLLAGAASIGYGYGQVWMPQDGAGNVEEVTRQAVGGILAVIFGAALVGAVTFWRD